MIDAAWFHVSIYTVIVFFFLIISHWEVRTYPNCGCEKMIEWIVVISIFSVGFPKISHGHRAKPVNFSCRGYTIFNPQCPLQKHRAHVFHKITRRRSNNVFCDIAKGYRFSIFENLLNFPMKKTIEDMELMIPWYHLTGTVRCCTKTSRWSTIDQI